MVSLEECISNVVIAKVVHCAYSPYQYSARHTDEFTLYKTASESYSHWYNYAYKQIGLSKQDLSPIVREGKRVFRVIKTNTTPFDFESSLTPANLKAHINLRGLLRGLEVKRHPITKLDDIKEVVTTNPTNMPKAEMSAMGSAFVKALSKAKTEPEEKVEVPISTYAAKKANEQSSMAEVIDSSVGSSVDTEEWKTIASVPRYECTRSGKIRTIKYSTTNSKGETIIRGGANISYNPRSTTMQTVLLKKNSLDKNSNTYRVAEVVARTFMENLPEKFIVRMKDGDSTNLDISNYIIETISEKEEAMSTPESTPTKGTKVKLNKEDYKDSWAYARAVKAQKRAAALEEQESVKTTTNAKMVSVDTTVTGTHSKEGYKISVTLPEEYVSAIKDKAEVIDMTPDEYITRAFKKYLKSVLTIG